jgi:hypothetical protein
MPVTQNGSYDVPVMARRDLHGDSHTYSSTSYSSNTSVFASPTRFMSNVRSQLASSYSAIRNRLAYVPAPIMNSPSVERTRRTSISTTNRTNTGYNLRRRPPVHSTPRDIDHDQSMKVIATEQDEPTNNINENPIESNANNENILVRMIQQSIYASWYLLRRLFVVPWWLFILLLLFAGLYMCKVTFAFVLMKFIENVNMLLLISL